MQIIFGLLEPIDFVRACRVSATAAKLASARIRLSPDPTLQVGMSQVLPCTKMGV
jgi:hypothetical protein